MSRKLKQTLLDLYPNIAAELDASATGKGAEELPPHSSRTVHWVCVRGHRWTTTIQARTQDGHGCPFCAGHRAIPGETSFAALHKDDLMQFWAATNKVDPDTILPGYTKIVNWKCSVAADHTWKSSPKSMRKGTRQCPYCSEHRPSSTHNLAVKFPKIAEQWHPTLNGELTPDKVSPGCSDRAWWVCPHDHEYDLPIAARTNAGKPQICPFCQGKRPHPDNGLVAYHPEIMDEWDWDKNEGIDPVLVRPRDNRTVYWWKCRVNPEHSWQDSTSHRGARGLGCPWCSGAWVSEENCLASVSPRDAALLDTMKSEVTPDKVHGQSRRELWWKCPVDPTHTWKCTVSAQVNKRNTGCQFCDKQAVSADYNLVVCYPLVAAEWHPDKNDVHPSTVLPSSAKSYWWRCAANSDHEWERPVTQRTLGENGCPECSKGRRTSIREIAIRNFTALVISDAQEACVESAGRLGDVDVLCENLKLVIEYDGAHFHKEHYDRDKRKNAALEKAGYKVVRLREAPLLNISSLDMSTSYRDPLPKVALALYDHLEAVLSVSFVRPTEEQIEGAAAAARAEYVRLCALGAQRKRVLGRLAALQEAKVDTSV